MSIPSGTRLGAYEIVSALGSGGMGEVYRARDAKLNREVAIKVLPGHLANDPAALQRFEREAQAVAALSHPNILAIYDFGSEQGIAYAVTELLEGETLRAKLASGALPVRKAVDHALQIAKGIAAAHEKSIIHRDLKPENIFVTKDGRVKVLDFGLAKALEPPSAAGVTAGASETQMATGTTPGMVLGTVGYMSPEQVRAQPVDHRTDIFSLGVVLYEMLTGKQPFRRDSQVETMNAILKEDAPEFGEIGASVPAGVDRIVRRALEKNPDERFHSAHDLGIALEAVSGASSQSGAVPASAAIAPKAGAMRRWLPAAAAVVGLGAVAFVVGRWTAGPSAAPAPSYRRLTFRSGAIFSARFAPDGNTAVYSARWYGDARRLYANRVESPESMPLAFTGDVASISRSGELALVMNRRVVRNYAQVGTLSRAPLSGGAARAVLDDVQDADWLPDGSGFVVSHYIGRRYQLEFPIGTPVYETAGYVSDPRVSPDGTRVAFVDHPILGDDRGTVDLVDRQGHVTKLTSEYSSLQGLAWTPSGAEIWFTGADEGSARALEAVTLAGRVRVVARVPGTLHLGDIAADGRVLLWQENVRDGLAGRAPGALEDRDLSWFDWGIPTALSDDGQWLLFDEEGDGGGPDYSVYLRKTDGSPAVRLGSGGALALSPDGAWALAQRLNPAPAQLMLLPTGAGQAKQVTSDAITHLDGAFTADGRHIVFLGFEAGHKARLYRQDLAGGAAKAITPEGLVGPLSPDGMMVATQDGRLYTLAGGSERPIPGFEKTDGLVRWGRDARTLFVREPADGGAAQVFQLDTTTGRRTPVRVIKPAAGTRGVNRILLTPDASAYVFGYRVVQCDLYQITGLK
ncbi:MAG: protein kinase domain-containing protein [Betaproteobacteria bacterium]